jgi:hypothetical protein
MNATDSTSARKLGSPILSLQHRDLLPERQVLQQQCSSTAKKANDNSEREPGEVEHGAFVADSGLRKLCHAVDFMA